MNDFLGLFLFIYLKKKKIAFRHLYIFSQQQHFVLGPFRWNLNQDEQYREITPPDCHIRRYVEKRKSKSERFEVKRDATLREERSGVENFSRSCDSSLLTPVCREVKAGVERGCNDTVRNTRLTRVLLILNHLGTHTAKRAWKVCFATRQVQRVCRLFLHFKSEDR